jgi:hypothetical protein
VTQQAMIVVMQPSTSSPTFAKTFLQFLFLIKIILQGLLKAVPCNSTTALIYIEKKTMQNGLSINKFADALILK